MKLKVHQRMDTISLREALYRARTMFRTALDQIAGNPDVQRSIAFAGQDIDAWLLDIYPFWIPAFAGMTKSYLIRASLIHSSLDDVIPAQAGIQTDRDVTGSPPSRGRLDRWFLRRRPGIQ